MHNQGSDFLILFILIMSYISEEVLKALLIFCNQTKENIIDLIEKVLKYYLFKEDKYIALADYSKQYSLEDITPYFHAILVALISLAKFTIPLKELKKYYTSLVPTIGEALTHALDSSLQKYRLRIIEHAEKSKESSPHLLEDMEWRLDVIVSNKLKDNIYLPMYMMKMKTKTKSEILQCNYPMMKRMHEELMQAKECLQGMYAKRIQRFAKFI